MSALLLFCGCDEKNEGPAPERFASVKAKPQVASSFCEKSWPAGQKKFTAPKLEGALTEAHGWRWVNLWATWCKPCVEEMGLLARWNEQLGVTIDLVSIDEPDADLASWKKKNLPGRISRIPTQPDFAAFLEGLGVDKNAAIPIHVLVDPDGWLRCVRVGAIHQESYGSARALIGG